MNYTYEYEITTKSVLVPWVIRTYLHSRWYNFLIVITKLLGIIILVGNGFAMEGMSLYALFLFFFFEIFIVYRYFFFQRRIQILFGNNRKATDTFTDTEMIMVTSNSTKKFQYNTFTHFVETKWFMFLYKDTLVVTFYFKPHMEDETINKLREILNTKINKQ